MMFDISVKCEGRFSVYSVAIKQGVYLEFLQIIKYVSFGGKRLDIVF